MIRLSFMAQAELWTGKSARAAAKAPLALVAAPRATLAVLRLHTPAKEASPVGHRRTAPPHALPLRPSGRAGAPGRAPTPGAALPHAHPQLFAEDRAG